MQVCPKCMSTECRYMFPYSRTNWMSCMECKHYADRKEFEVKDNRVYYRQLGDIHQEYTDVDSKGYMEET